MRSAPRPFPCKCCGGEGRTFRSRHGGNDPDVYDAGPCDVCKGSGNQPCEYCGEDVATRELRHGTATDLLCDRCMAEIEESEADA